MDLHLGDRVFVVTGGSRGVGRAVVQALLAEGAAVAACGRDAETLNDAYPGDRERLLLRAVDVRDPEAMAEFVEAAAAGFGQLDGAVAAAGAGAPDSLATTTAPAMTDQFAIKVHPILNLVQAVRPRMAGGGSIVVIGGVTAHSPHRHMVAASAGQAAARNLTVNLAAELAPAIRINTVALGPVEGRPQDELFRADPRGLTYAEWQEDQVRRRGIPLGRFGTPQDVAPTVLPLLSPLSAYTTGASVLVSGGLGMHS